MYIYIEREIYMYIGIQSTKGATVMRDWPHAHCYHTKLAVKVIYLITYMSRRGDD